MNLLDTVREFWAFSGLDAKSIVDTNAFGNIIVLDRGGRYWRICPEELSCKQIASSAGELQSLRTSADFQSDWQMAGLVRLARSKLGVPAEGRCYCLKIPGVLGGEYSADNVGTITLAELIGASGAMAVQIRDLPDGATIKLTFVD